MIESGALLAILGLILVKEAGVPIPVPGDLVVIGAGAASALPAAVAWADACCPACLTLATLDRAR